MSESIRSATATGREANVWVKWSTHKKHSFTTIASPLAKDSKFAVALGWRRVGNNCYQKLLRVLPRLDVAMASMILGINDKQICLRCKDFGTQV